MLVRRSSVSLIVDIGLYLYCLRNIVVDLSACASPCADSKVQSMYLMMATAACRCRKPPNGCSNITVHPKKLLYLLDQVKKRGHLRMVRQKLQHQTNKSFLSKLLRPTERPSNPSDLRYHNMVSQHSAICLLACDG